MGKHGLYGGQDPPVGGHIGVERALHRHLAPPQGQRGRRPAADKRPSPPGPGVLHRLQHEPRLVLDQAGVGRHRGRQVGQQLSPDRDNAPLPGQVDELLPGQGTARRHAVQWSLRSAAAPANGDPTAGGGPGPNRR